MSKYYCWNSAYDSERDAICIDTWSDEKAAQKFMEREFDKANKPTKQQYIDERQTIHVKDEEGVEKVFDVRCKLELDVTAEERE